MGQELCELTASHPQSARQIRKGTPATLSLAYNRSLRSQNDNARADMDAREKINDIGIHHSDATG